MDDYSSDASTEEESTTEAQFSKAIDYLTRNHSKPELEPYKLQFYGLYKQATCGKCTTKRPGFFQFADKAKWTAWNDTNNLSTTEAKQQYIDLLSQVLPMWHTEPKNGSWAKVSALAIPEDNHIPDDEKLITDFLKEGNVPMFREHFQNVDQVNSLDDTGLGLIHWAADRNQVEILHILLDSPAININLRDSDGQTALHYASSCGNAECLTLLLSRGADKSVLDNDGETALALAFDENIAHLLNIT